MILSIESSCDDSSIAITKIDSKEIIFHKKISQVREHNRYGGVVPELASRLNATALPEILEQAKPHFKDLKAIAVTNEPGLSVTLMEGVMMAKALALTLELPLIAINHLKAHIYSLFIEKEESFPQLTMLVSGGHTQIIDLKSYSDIEVLVNTLDDSFGESFDKVAKMLNLGYPGGPIVQEYAKKGDPKRFNFPIPLQNPNRLAFSFSGLKNAVRVEIEKLGSRVSEQDICDISASFEQIATKHLMLKLKKVVDIKRNSNERVKNISVVGGASANLHLRENLNTYCKEIGAKLHLAELKYCSDNAVMVGRLAIEKFQKGEFIDSKDLTIKSKFSNF